jgi:hypothetical protein
LIGVAQAKLAPFISESLFPCLFLHHPPVGTRKGGIFNLHNDQSTVGAHVETIRIERLNEHLHKTLCINQVLTYDIAQLTLRLIELFLQKLGLS